MHRDLLCPVSAVFATALQQIDRNALGIVCIVDDAESVVGVLTDGDIRRALLKGCSLDSPIRKHVNCNFSWMPAGLPREAYLSPVAQKAFRQVIVLDNNKRLSEIVTYKDTTMLPVASINLAGNELRYVAECIQTNWISSQGKFVKEFEESFALYHDMPYSLCCTSGTAALHLALLGLGIGKGDEVIVPVSTFGATANTVIHVGAVPVFVDITPDTWCIDPALIEQAITPRTKAIIPVHLYGHPADMRSILDIAARHRLKIIEDCAESLGARIGDQLTGTMSDVSCFSFFSNKVITTGEGGMVLTRDAAVYRRMQQYRDHGTSLSRRYWHDMAGFNYRMTNIQAAIGLAQLERIESFLSARQRIAARYHEALQDNPELQLPVSLPGYANIYWLYTIALTEHAPITRDALIAKLKERNIDSRPFFPALFHQPAYAAYDRGIAFPVGQCLEEHALSLPTSNYLSLSDIDMVCNVLTSIINNE